MRAEIANWLKVYIFVPEMKKADVESVVDGLKNRRKALKLSQSQLSDRMDCNSVTISKYESGVQEPSLGAFMVWVEALECDLRIVSRQENVI